VEALRQEIETVRVDGLATAVGEREPDLNAVAVPVFDARGDLAAVLGLQGPAARFTLEAMTDARPTLVAAGRQVSRALGA
jgi:IclR family acetate operon transcriptional repressor